MTAVEVGLPSVLADIRERAAEVEAARRLPPDLLEQLIAAGCFSVLVPSSHGGAGADLPTAMGMYEALARADASVAWTVMIGSSAFCDLAGLPRPTFDALFARGPVPIAGVFNPTGTAVAADGGYRVSGRWAFASGCEHAGWLYGNCVSGVPSGDGPPPLRIVLFDPDQVTIEDTWHVSGLRGTGSHHFHVEDVFVPAKRTYDLFAEEPCLDEPILRVPPPSLFALEIASVAVGTAQGALDDILAIAAGKVPLLSPSSLAANPLFQQQLAGADTSLRAARNLLYADAEAAWETAVAGGEYEPVQRAQIRATAVWVAQQAADVVETAYRAGGGGSVFVDSPLQRRLRDIQALNQHFLVRPDTMVTAGAVYAGQEPGLMVF